MTFNTSKYDWIIYEKAQGNTKGFYQVWCTKLFMSKQTAFDNIVLICKALEYYQKKGGKGNEEHAVK